MPKFENRCVLLNARPVGVPGPKFFELVDRPAGEPGEGEFLVKNLFVSVDPAMRGWVNDAANYSPPVPVGDVMRAIAVGEIVESKNREYAVGERVTGTFGWQRYAVSDGANVLRKLTDADPSPSMALGALGLNGLTAFFGLLEPSPPEAGETLVVSTAAGAVGSCVGQIGKIMGCRTVGIAGGPEKVRACLDEFGFDAAIDYKGAADLAGEIGAACPNGVDVYFDNTCGPISDAVMTQLNVGARITVCGTAALSTWDPIPEGPRVNRQLLVARARMTGFLVHDHRERFPEGVAQLAAWVAEGKIKAREHILDGLASAPNAISMLYRGENTGKLLIRVD